MSKRVSRPLMLMTAMSGCQNFHHTIIYKDPTSMKNRFGIAPSFWFHISSSLAVFIALAHVFVWN